MFGKKKSVYLKKERCLKKSWEKRYDFLKKNKKIFLMSLVKKTIFFWYDFNFIPYFQFNAFIFCQKKIVFIYVLVKKKNSVHLCIH
jgi:hypothetical protein